MLFIVGLAIASVDGFSDHDSLQCVTLGLLFWWLNEAKKALLRFCVSRILPVR